MAPKFALFTKESKLPLNKGFKNMFELLQSCAQPSICCEYSLEEPRQGTSNEYLQHMFMLWNKRCLCGYLELWYNAGFTMPCLIFTSKKHVISEAKTYITKTRLFKYVENFTTKNWKFSDKNSHIFHISPQNVDCRHSLELPLRGGSNEYLQSMLLSRNKKNNVYPCKPQFYCIKVGFKGVNII